MKILLEKGANVNHVANDGNMALAWAALNGNLKAHNQPIAESP